MASSRTPARRLHHGSGRWAASRRRRGAMPTRRSAKASSALMLAQRLGERPKARCGVRGREGAQMGEARRHGGKVLVGDLADGAERRSEVAAPCGAEVEIGLDQPQDLGQGLRGAHGGLQRVGVPFPLGNGDGGQDGPREALGGQAGSFGRPYYRKAAK